MTTTIELADLPQLSQISDLAHSIWRDYYLGIISRPQIEFMLAADYSLDQLEKDADKGYDGLPEIIKDETIALPYYSHTERGFAADFGIAGYKKFLEIARGYAEQYGESMY